MSIPQTWDIKTTDVGYEQDALSPAPKYLRTMHNVAPRFRGEPRKAEKDAGRKRKNSAIILRYSAKCRTFAADLRARAYGIIYKQKHHTQITS